jgi:hypothetical protein
MIHPRLLAWLGLSALVLAGGATGPQQALRDSGKEDT